MSHHNWNATKNTVLLDMILCNWYPSIWLNVITPQNVNVMEALLHSFLTSVPDGDLTAAHHACTTPQGTAPSSHWTGAWVGPSACLDTKKWSELSLMWEHQTPCNIVAAKLICITATCHHFHVPTVATLLCAHSVHYKYELSILIWHPPISK
jgi:hypothetical protein